MTIKPIRRVSKPNNLNCLMAKAGLTDADVAQRYGVAESSVAAWRRGQFMPLHVQWQFAEVLGVSIDEMLGEWEK